MLLMLLFYTSRCCCRETFPETSNDGDCVFFAVTGKWFRGGGVRRRKKPVTHRPRAHVAHTFDVYVILCVQYWTHETKKIPCRSQHVETQPGKLFIYYFNCAVTGPPQLEKITVSPFSFWHQQYSLYAVYDS